MCITWKYPGNFETVEKVYKTSSQDTFETIWTYLSSSGHFTAGFFLSYGQTFSVRKKTFCPPTFQIHISQVYYTERSDTQPKKIIAPGPGKNHS